MATGTAGPQTSYPQPCLRPQCFPLLRPGCHSELDRVPSGDHSALAAPGSFVEEPRPHHSAPKSAPSWGLQPGHPCPHGSARWAAERGTCMADGPSRGFHLQLHGWTGSSLSCGLAHHCHVGRLLARWLPWVPGKLLVTVMSSWEHGHQVAGERVTRGTCCVYSVVTELVLGLQGPVRDPGLTCTSGLLVPSLWGSPGVMRWGVVPDLSDLGKLRELWTLVSRLFTRFYFKCRISPYPAGCDSGAKASGNSRRFRSPG